MSPWIHLCHPGYTYFALVTLMSPRIHLCPPGYTYQVQYIRTVLYFVSKWRYVLHLYVDVHKYTVFICGLIALHQCGLCVSCVVQPPPLWAGQKSGVGIRYGCSHSSHSQSIEIIEKISLHEFFSTFHYANKHKKNFFLIKLLQALVSQKRQLVPSPSICNSGSWLSGQCCK